MSSSTVTELNILKDFEVLWTDRVTFQPKDMDNVTVEIYHYEGPNPGQIKVPLSEPYIFTETINDQVNIGSVKTSENILIDAHIILDLNLVTTQLEGLECPPNDFVVPNTCNKVSIVNGLKKYALSACELASLINLQASGYVAHAMDGFVVLTGDFDDSDAYLQVGNASWNSVVGIVEGTQYFGQGTEKIIDLDPTEMLRVELGTYVKSKVPIQDPPYVPGERYFVVYKGTDQISNLEEILQENFTILKPKTNSLNISFIK